MPPKKGSTVSRRVSTRYNTRSAPDEPAVKHTSHEKDRLESTSSDSDIEVDILEEESQDESQTSSLQHQQPVEAPDDPDEQDSELHQPAPEPSSEGSLQSLPAVPVYLRSRLVDIHSPAAATMAMRPKLLEVYTNLLSLLTSTAETPGANHSFLLLGARGTGKSLVMQRVLSELVAKFNVHEGSPTIGIVRLTGLAHTEDVVAFREIARQLCKCFNCKYSKAASLAENLTFLREMLQELGRGHKVAIFVLDEFDLFAKKAKQTTLYNLLDAMQSAGMQAAVVGLSCRHDVMELLEKRVRSRFSHRKQLVPEIGEDFASSGDNARDVLGAMLSVPELSRPQQPPAEAALQWNAAIKQTLGTEAIMQQLRLMLNQGFGKPKDLADVAMEAVMLMQHQPGLSHQQAVLAGIASVRHAYNQQADVVGSCSVLELFMLVAIYRIKRRGHDNANFEMVHDEYCKLLDQGGTGDRRSKTAALRAFEHLIASSLVTYVDDRAEEKGGLREFRPARVNVVLQEIDAGLQMHNSCPSLLKSALSHEAVRNAFAH